jgi:UDP-glucose 4-epimerase
MPRERHVLVTGGAGFIGSHLVDRLLEEDFAVTALDNMSTGMLTNVARHMGKGDFALVKADIRNSQVLCEEVKRCRYAFHLAAVADVQKSVRDPLLTDQINVVGTLNLLEACRHADVDLVVYASSCAVYGNAGKKSVREDAPLEPLSPYGASKLAAEKYCLAFHRTYGLPVVCLRFFNVYGPRQRSGPYGGVINKFVRRLMHSRPPIIYGDGEQTRDFVNIKDAVEACILSLRKRNAMGKAINIGSGRCTTINQLAKELAILIGKKDMKPLYRPARLGEVRHSLADITLARKALGYQPSVALREGLQEYVHEYVRTTGR